jgi:spore coat protein YutH
MLYDPLFLIAIKKYRGVLFLKEILQRYFPYQFQNETMLDQYTVFQEKDGYVIVLPADHVDENYITEMYIVTQFLQNSGQEHIAAPIYSNNGSFIVPINEEHSVFLCRAKSRQAENSLDQLITFLMSFHHIGHSFPYSPLYMNRYGHWKNNWENIIDNIDFVRSNFMERDHLLDWERLWLESSFYFIGIGENAIQYLQDSEERKEFNHFDQPVFAFERIQPFPHSGIVFPTQIVHDHPVRDLAEVIRHIFINQGRDGIPAAIRLLYKYQQERPLSIFGCRLLVARLLFPIPFIDYTAKILQYVKDADVEYRRLKIFLSDQAEYEKCLALFQQELMNHFRVAIPFIDWLHRQI